MSFSSFPGDPGLAIIATIGQGTLASRPSPFPGTLYFATDTGELFIANQAGNAWQSISKTSATTLIVAGGIDISATGKGIAVSEATNGKQGVATLVAGTVTVANTSVTATSRIMLTAQEGGALTGVLRVTARTPGTSFTIGSSIATDTATVAWEIFEVG